MDVPIKQAEADIDNLKLEMYGVMGAYQRGKRGNQLLEDDKWGGFAPNEDKVTPNKGDMSPAWDTKTDLAYLPIQTTKFDIIDDQPIPTTHEDVSDHTSSIYSKHPEFWDLYWKASDNYAEKLDAKHEEDGKPLNVNSLKNFENVLAGVGMEEGDNYLVEYAKSFVGKLPYEKGGDDLTKGADCSGFVQAIYGQFGLKIDGSTRSLSEKADEMKYNNKENFISTPWLNSNGEYIPFKGTIGEAYKAVDDFCAGLKPGDLILFDLGSSHDDIRDGVFGRADHVVMYAGNGMIVQEHEVGRNAEYHPITELIFNRAENNPAGDESFKGNYVWEKRMPIFALSLLSDEDRKRLTY